MFEVLILAVALSMDAFAVSIGLGSKYKHNTRALAAKAAIYFGLFHALMPLIGFLGGKGVFGWVEGYAHWIAFLLLLLVGIKMIYESIFQVSIKETTQITHKMLLALTIATSIDAVAAGFALTLFDVNPFFACALIGATAFIFSWLGVYVGAKNGTYLEGKAELFGGIVLIVIGFKVLLF